MIDRTFPDATVNTLCSAYSMAPRAILRISTGEPVGTPIGGYLYLTHKGTRRAGLDVAFVLHFRRAPRAPVRALDRDPLNLAAENLCDVPGVRMGKRGAVCVRVDLMPDDELSDVRRMLGASLAYNPTTGALGWRMDPGQPFADAVTFNNRSPIINLMGRRFRAQDAAWLLHRGTRPRCPVRSTARDAEGRPDLRAQMLEDLGTPMQNAAYLARIALAASARNADAAQGQPDAPPEVYGVTTPDTLPDLF